MAFLEKIGNFDVAAFKWCLSRRYSRQIARLSRWISRLGDGIYYLLGGVVLIWLEPVYGMSFFLCALIGFAFELPSYLLLKNTFKRQRPHDAIQDFVAYLVPSDKFSFPSGHTAAAFVMATTTSHYYPELAAPAYLIAVLIGTSRVLLGVHFPTDILAGMVLGTTSAIFAINIVAT
jgi:undecaprenyl-diphosphatase